MSLYHRADLSLIETLRENGESEREHGNLSSLYKTKQ